MATQTRVRRFTILSTLIAAGALIPRLSHAADLTLTAAFLDAHGGFVDFKQIAHSLGPGDRVLIEGHTRPSLHLVNLVYGAPGNPIVVTNTGSAPLVIDDVGETASDGIKIWGAQHVVLSGSPVDGEDFGIQVLNAASVGIDIDYNNYQQGRIAGEFEDTRDLVIANVEIGFAGFAGIQAKYEMSQPYPVADPLLDGLEVHHTYIHDVAGEGLYIGWTSDEHPDVANVSIHDNRIEEAGWDGIQLNRSRGENRIYRNVVDGYAGMSFTASGGAFTAQNEGITVGAAKADIYDNFVRASNQYSGTAIFYSIYQPSRIFNNVLVHGGFGSTQREAMIYVRQISAGRLAPQAGAMLDIVNNTLVQPDANGIELLGGVAVPVAIVNNAIVEPLNGGQHVRQQNSTSPVTYATNLFTTTLAAAGFSGPGDYRPQESSPLVDTGTDVAGRNITTDYDGVARPQGAAYDIGAYERWVDDGPASVTVLTPEDWGTASGSAYCAAVGAFDSPPSWDATQETPVGDQAQPHADTGTAYANRFFYVDFGPDWASLRIAELWTRYRPFSGGSYGGFASLWWDDDTDTVNDGSSATGFNFATAQALSNVGNQQWVRDREFAVPVTPAGRYLVIHTGSAPTTRANEFAFVGYRQP